METEKDKVIPFLDVLIANRNNNLNTTTYHKLTYYDLLLVFNSFPSRFYKISLIKCLIDCAYKIYNTRSIVYNDAAKIKETLKRNCFLLFLIEKITKLCMDYVSVYFRI